MNKTHARIVCLFAVLGVGCGSKGDPLSFLTNHAVGTYVGGGSLLFGPDSCTYAATRGVFHDNEGESSAEAAKGPRFVAAAGTITQDCDGTKRTIHAVVPTAAKLTGPTKVKVGDDRERFRADLVADGKELGGEASIDWKLGHDCAGIADFGPVYGAQDTGGPARSRTLVTKRKGACTVIAILTTGSSLATSFVPRSFQAEVLVTIE